MDRKGDCLIIQLVLRAKKVVVMIRGAADIGR